MVYGEAGFSMTHITIERAITVNFGNFFSKFKQAR